ncbi:5890_t:CDS:1 [Funneliformis caledonium]|uniref:5890_t:CDS:1 n=1 Tax=Funneliformis caledonium TaxID=1117310 RepID=A0A9N9DHE4_9GLOM|nr:5890_t:CDS:1 [Funneliformis caledonium]
MTYKCMLADILEEKCIVVLNPERNTYIKWKLPSPQTSKPLILKKFKTNFNSYMIFQLDCTSEIIKSKIFIENTSETETRKAAAAIWNSAEESVKTEYHNLNLNIKSWFVKKQNVVILSVVSVVDCC